MSESPDRESRETHHARRNVHRDCDSPRCNVKGEDPEKG